MHRGDMGVCMGVHVGSGGLCMWLSTTSMLRGTLEDAKSLELRLATRFEGASCMGHAWCMGLGCMGHAWMHGACMGVHGACTGRAWVHEPGAWMVHA